MAINRQLGNYLLRTDDSQGDTLKIIYSPTDTVVARFEKDRLKVDMDFDVGGSKLHISDTEPSNPSDGDVWIDTS